MTYLWPYRNRINNDIPIFLPLFSNWLTPILNY